MTFTEFLVKLEKTPRTWALHSIGMDQRMLLRANMGPLAQHCPLQVVFGKQHGYDTAAETAGMRPRVVRAIINAADNNGAPKARQRLLKACGL